MKDKHSNLLDPHFFTGFVQALGCFHVNLQENRKGKHKMRIKPTFYLTQRNENNTLCSPILEMGKQLLKTGYCVKDKRNNCSSLCVSTLKGLSEYVLPHFEKYPLLSRKNDDFLTFKSIVIKMNKKVHREKESFFSLVEEAVSMNNSGKYRKKYHKQPSNTIKKGTIDSSGVLNPGFVSGLLQGDGSFGISFNTRKNKKNETVPKLSPFFSLVQENESRLLLEKFKEFFKSGKVYHLSSNYSRWMVSDRKLLLERVLPHFVEAPLIGVKNEQLLIFKKGLDILEKPTTCKREKRENIRSVIELCYDINMGGKRRKITKLDYLRAIAS